MILLSNVCDVFDDFNNLLLKVIMVSCNLNFLRKGTFYGVLLLPFAKCSGRTIYMEGKTHNLIVEKFVSTLLGFIL